MSTADREAAEAIIENTSVCDSEYCQTCESCDEKTTAAILSLIAEVREGDAKACEAIAKEAAREAKHARAHGNDLAWECEKASETIATECAAAIRKGEA